MTARMRLAPFLLLALAACGGSSTSVPSDGRPKPDADDDVRGPDRSAPVSSESAERTGPYGSCAAVALASTYVDPIGFELGFPSAWSGQPSATNAYTLGRSYSYVPTGASTPLEAIAQVMTTTGSTARDEADVTRMLEDKVSGYPDADVHRFTIDGRPAISWWYEEAPPQPGCYGCAADPGPNFVRVNVATAKGLAIIEARGGARVNAAEEVFCEIQAIEASLSLVP